MPRWASRITRFQSTPPHGGRPTGRAISTAASRFQSTPPHGGRHELTVVKATNRRVSIHAPARRATRGQARLHHRGRGFNPRPRTEGDRDSAGTGSGSNGFNPRPRTEGDVSAPHSRHNRNMFQSTPPHGGRHGVFLAAATIVHVSIHAPARRATCPRRRRTTDMTMFQSTPPHGGRQGALVADDEAIKFQSTPPHGGRHLSSSSSVAVSVFQSTPPHGGRPVFPFFLGTST